jgi:hypothetical protein
LIFSLKRLEDVIVPSYPSELIKTEVPPPEVVPKIFPIKQLPLRFAPAVPMQIT